MNIALQENVAPQVHRWTGQEYTRMAELGLFEGKRVELIEGAIFEMAAMGSRHTTGVTLLMEHLRPLFGPGYVLRPQMPIEIDPISAPEPDIAIFRGTARDFAERHPTTAELIVEVADSSLRYDRTVKLPIYARAGVPDYWILNLIDQQLEVYRKPIYMAGEPPGFEYSEVATLKPEDSISTLAEPSTFILMADLLP